MSWLLKFWDSTVGKKVVMAATGILLVGFVLGHMAGNLQMFLGADAMNRYAAFLKSTGELLWVARLGLLGAVTLRSTPSSPAPARGRGGRRSGTSTASS
jgi:succinate dehydrogenase / fumarate reductase cytochrome b subunit